MPGAGGTPPARMLREEELLGEAGCWHLFVYLWCAFFLHFNNHPSIPTAATKLCLSPGLPSIPCLPRQVGWVGGAEQMNIYLSPPQTDTRFGYLAGQLLCVLHMCILPFSNFLYSLGKRRRKRSRALKQLENSGTGLYSTLENRN